MAIPERTRRVSGRGVAPSFAVPEDHSGLEVFDPIERHRCALRTPESVEPTPIDPDAFRSPVDAGVAITTDAIEFPNVVQVCLRDDERVDVTSTRRIAYEYAPENEYDIEICEEIKLYLQVESEVTVVADDDRTRIAFGGPTRVLVGARSHHTRPAATVTTTENPLDVMAAVSTFGSALKTTSPERAYPTLRGHLPRIELGSRLRVPPGLEGPETGVTLELPPTLRSAYVAAPLAFYLGGRVVPGSSPVIRTDAGFVHELTTDRGFEAEVERVLKQSFFLDCLTRTEGYYPVDLAERRRVESRVDLDFEALYERPLAEQLEAYLSVPFESVADAMPEWKLATHVRPDPENVELLPFLVNDLAVIRTPDAVESADDDDGQGAAIDEFVRTSGEETTGPAARAASSASDSPTYVQPERLAAQQQAWAGDGRPVNVTKATLAAYEHRLERDPVEGDIGITVVCNDASMAEEWDVVDGVYGSRAELPFDVTFRHELSTAELARLLESQVDFLHYVGHVDEEGIECADGKLDARDLDSVGVDAFFLNACRSYEQGMALIEAGSIGGVVTYADVVNSGAVQLGCAMARLLNRGFPLGAALSLARRESVVGSHYVVVGASDLSIVQTDGAFPNSASVTPAEDGYEVDVATYATSHGGIGSLFRPRIPENEQYLLTLSTLATFDVSRAELEQFLDLEDIPVEVDGDLRWSDELDL